jgi:hypothetical protein
MRGYHRETTLSAGHANGFCLEARDSPRWRWLAHATTERLLIGRGGPRLGTVPVIGLAVGRIVDLVDCWADSASVLVLRVPLYIEQARAWNPDLVRSFLDGLTQLDDGLLGDEKNGLVFDEYGCLLFARCLVCGERLAAQGSWSEKVRREHLKDCRGLDVGAES